MKTEEKYRSQNYLALTWLAAACFIVAAYGFIFSISTLIPIIREIREDNIVLDEEFSNKHGNIYRRYAIRENRNIYFNQIKLSFGINTFPRLRLAGADISLLSPLLVTAYFVLSGRALRDARIRVWVLTLGRFVSSLFSVSLPKTGDIPKLPANYAVWLQSIRPWLDFVLLVLLLAGFAVVAALIGELRLATYAPKYVLDQTAIDTVMFTAAAVFFYRHTKSCKIFYVDEGGKLSCRDQIAPEKLVRISQFTEIDFPNLTRLAAKSCFEKQALSALQTDHISDAISWLDLGVRYEIFRRNEQPWHKINDRTIKLFAGLSYRYKSLNRLAQIKHKLAEMNLVNVFQPEPQRWAGKATQFRYRWKIRETYNGVKLPRA